MYGHAASWSRDRDKAVPALGSFLPCVWAVLRLRKEVVPSLLYGVARLEGFLNRLRGERSGDEGWAFMAVHCAVS